MVGWRRGSVSEGAEGTPGFYLRRAIPIDGGPASAVTASRHPTVRVAVGGLRATANEADGALRATAWERPDRHGHPAGGHRAAGHPGDRRPGHRGPAHNPIRVAPRLRAGIRRPGHNPGPRDRLGRPADTPLQGHRAAHRVDKHRGDKHRVDKHPADRRPACRRREGTHLADSPHAGTHRAARGLATGHRADTRAPGGAGHWRWARRTGVRQVPSLDVRRRSRPRSPRPAGAAPGAAGHALTGRGAHPEAAPGLEHRPGQRTPRAASPTPAAGRFET